MRLDEIKIETLKIMFANTDDMLIEENIDTYKTDEQYKAYLAMMNGSINRCFSDIERKKVLPSKTFALSFESGTTSDKFIRFNLSELIQDYKDIDRITYEDAYGNYNGNAAYKMEGSVLVLPIFDEEKEYYKVLYKPRIARITSATEESEEISIPEDIASAIPYYVKGDLFRVDEPREASEARNWYEAAMEQSYYEASAKDNCVYATFDQTEI